MKDRKFSQVLALAIILPIFLVGYCASFETYAQQPTQPPQGEPQRGSETFNAGNVTTALPTSNGTMAISEIPDGTAVTGIIIDTIGNTTSIIEGKDNLIEQRESLAQELGSVSTDVAICVEWAELLIVYPDGSYEYYYVEVWYYC